MTAANVVKHLFRADFPIVKVCSENPITHGPIHVSIAIPTAFSSGWHRAINDRINRVEEIRHTI